MIKPTNDWLWIEMDEGEISGTKKLDSGLFLTPDTKSAGGLVQGIVIAVGPGKYSDSGSLVPMRIKQGEKVMFTKTIALQNKIVHDDKPYILIREENVMAIVE